MVAERTRRVLVVDDIPSITTFFRSVLARVSTPRIEVTVETDARAALERLSHEQFDVVVSDFRMPGADGAEVLAAAHRSHPRGHRIMMTGYNEIPTGVARLRAASVDAYLQKPLRTQDVLLLLCDFLDDFPQSIEACRRHARDLEAMAGSDASGARPSAP